MKYLRIMSVLLLAVTMVNCSKDDDKKAPTADFTFQVNELEVTFNGSTTDATSYMWDFGDGETSTEKAPVHTYTSPKSYTVKFTAKGDGGEDSQTKEVVTLPSLEYLLTGGPDNADGKSWILDKVADLKNDGVGVIDNNLTILQPIDADDLMGRISLHQAYKDVFTFKYDGSYTVDNSDHFGGSIMSAIYANMNYKMEEFPAGDVLGMSLDMNNVPLLDIHYTPKTDAKWSVSTDDFTVNAINFTTGTVGPVNFTNKNHLIIDEYMGFRDYSMVVIIKNINETHMNVAIVLHAVEPSAANPDAYKLPSHMLHMTFVAK